MTHTETDNASNLRATARRDGFSLMELMIVVVITGVLAAIAIPTFTSYVYKARTSEAVSFLGVIKLRQESARSEDGQYLKCGTIVDPANIAFVPSPASPASSSQVFPSDACFNALGAKPDGPVRFGYGWAAGTPADAQTVGSLTDTDKNTGYGLTQPLDHYFIAQAKGDLDDDGIKCIIEVTSFTRGAWIGSMKPGGTLVAEAQGYE